MYTTESLLSQYLKGMTNLGGTHGAPDTEAPIDVNYADGVGEGGNLIDPGLDESGGGEEAYSPSDWDKAMGALDYPFMAHLAGKPLTFTANQLTKHGIAKTGAKLLGKAGSRLIPGLGWALFAGDLIDSFVYPIYDHIPGGDYLTWRDTSSGQSSGVSGAATGALLNNPNFTDEQKNSLMGMYMMNPSTAGMAVSHMLQNNQNKGQ